jgi:uncharacterized protein involved in tolerance to divalent cations
MIVVMVNLADEAEARRIGEGLLRKRLIGNYSTWITLTAQLIDNEAVEIKVATMMMKTTVRWFDDISEYIASESRIDMMDLVAFDTEKVEPHFQQWLNDSTK